MNQLENQLSDHNAAMETHAAFPTSRRRSCTLAWILRSRKKLLFPLLSLLLTLSIIIYTVQSAIEEGLLRISYAPTDPAWRIQTPNITFENQTFDPLQGSSDLLKKLLKEFQFEYVPFATYAINMTKCQNLPLDRHVPDARHNECKSISYPEHEQTVSVIIPFHNEAWPNLLRTIHSVLSKTPTKSLAEIILVNDMSTKENLKEPLEAYLSHLPKVILLKTTKREGLIRARLVGAHAAKGEVLIFMDAHIECNTGWLEPLLDLIAKDQTTIAIPTIDFISPLSFKYIVPKVISRGTFSWELDYVWKNIPKNLWDKPTTAIPTATNIGCTMAIHKQYFMDIGEFDDGMYIWGGENLEISFRVWMCGGSIKIAPCSRVGHLFRRNLPYTFPDKNIISKNLQRVAEVWMDEYKEFFYLTSGKWFPPNEQEVSSLEKRKSLRRKLKCKSFKWYLENVAVDLVVPLRNAKFYGQLKNAENSLCTTYNPLEENLVIDYCTEMSREQIFHYNHKQQIVQSRCFTAVLDDGSRGKVLLRDCDDQNVFQQWIFVELSASKVRNDLIGVDQKRPTGHFMIEADHKKLCLDVLYHHNKRVLVVSDCITNVGNQSWTFTYKLHHW